MESTQVKEVLRSLIELVKEYTEAEVKEDLEATEIKSKLDQLVADNQEYVSLVSELQSQLEALKQSQPVQQ